MFQVRIWNRYSSLELKPTTKNVLSFFSWRPSDVFVFHNEDKVEALCLIGPAENGLIKLEEYFDPFRPTFCIHITIEFIVFLSTIFNYERGNII